MLLAIFPFVVHGCCAAISILTTDYDITLQSQHNSPDL